MYKSHPSRVRGLKYYLPYPSTSFFVVAPFTGAWIEINGNINCFPRCIVAPFTGAWIEIQNGWSIPATWLGRTLHGCVD